jgi:tryptophan synthase alpha subunit
LADAVVVGSALVNVVADHQDDPEALLGAVATFTGSLRQGIDNQA